MRIHSPGAGRKPPSEARTGGGRRCRSRAGGRRSGAWKMPAGWRGLPPRRSFRDSWEASGSAITRTEKCHCGKRSSSGLMMRGGELYAAVTRNGYGLLVLNAARAPFIDWDFPPVPYWENLKFSVVRLFNKSASSPVSRREADLRSRLERFFRRESALGHTDLPHVCRAARPCDHDLFEPQPESTLAMLQSVARTPCTCGSAKCRSVSAPGSLRSRGVAATT